MNIETTILDFQISNTFEEYELIYECKGKAEDA